MFLMNLIQLQVPLFFQFYFQKKKIDKIFKKIKINQSNLIEILLFLLNFLLRKLIVFFRYLLQLKIIVV